MPSLTEPEIRLLSSLIQNNFNISKTARDTYQHRNTVLYQIKKAKYVHGVDFTDFRDVFHFLHGLPSKVTEQILGRDGNAQKTANYRKH